MAAFSGCPGGNSRGAKARQVENRRDKHTGGRVCQDSAPRVDVQEQFHYSRIMEILKATEAFAAISQPTRLAVLRLLVKAGTDGMPAGDIGLALAVKANTMSANLAVLHRAGLVRSVREGRVIRYFADMEGIGSLVGFLLEDCCGGRPELCRPVVKEISCAC
jgi:ArsR family transcriptional regulator, arsenate/arsenite/antimonite-responsive transcriptional repressor